MIIYLVRHGETPWNKDGLLQGHTDIELSEAGEEQAHGLRNVLSNITFNAAYSSDLKRARKTAEIVLKDKDIPLLTTELLRETSMGPFEGKHILEVDKFNRTFNETMKHLPKLELLSRKRIEGLETYAQVYGRFLNFIEQYAVKHEGSTLLVATHGGFIRSILEHQDLEDRSGWKVGNCGYIVLRMENGKPVIDHMHNVSKHQSVET